MNSCEHRKNGRTIRPAVTDLHDRVVSATARQFSSRDKDLSCAPVTAPCLPVLRLQIGPLLVFDAVLMKRLGSHLPRQDRKARKFVCRSSFQAGYGDFMR